MFGLLKPSKIPSAERALPGRAEPIPTAETHSVLGTPLKPPFPDGIETILFGFGCFWGAERRMWGIDGVYTTAVGYAGGSTPNATYKEVCSGQTGHNEVVLVAYDPVAVSVDALLKVFWEAHDPTQGMRQGNDVGTQYRSGIYVTTEVQREVALATKKSVGAQLSAKGFPAITTEILDAPEFYYAEDYHQQYLDKNPGGYCGLRGTGVICPVGTPA